MKNNCMKTLLILAISVLFSISVSADSDSKNNNKVNNFELTTSVENATAFKISGVIIDEKSNETLAGAAIVVNGKKYYSDLDGNFLVNDIKPGEYEMVVELISYEPFTLVVDSSINQNINITLHQK